MLKIIGITIFSFFGFILGGYLILNMHISLLSAMSIFLIITICSFRIISGDKFFLHIRTGFLDKSPPNLERLLSELIDSEDIEIAQSIGIIIKKMTGEDLDDIKLNTNLWVGGPLYNYRINYKARIVFAGRLTKKLNTKIKESNLDSLITMRDFIYFVKSNRMRHD